MTIQYTDRAEIPYPQGSDAAVVHTDLQNAVNRADDVFAMYAAGTRAARPVTGKEGQIYRQTDASAGYPANTLWWYNGSAWTLLFDPNGTHGTPTGVTVGWAGTAAQVPAGWVACDGSPVTAAANPILRQFLIDAGSPYGTSGTDPRVPDCRGRVEVGLDDMGTGDAGRLDVANALGGVGGSQYHTLVTSEMPSHAHPITVSNAATGITASTSSAGAHSHTVNSGTGNTSSAGSHTHTLGAVGDHAHGTPEFVASQDNRAINTTSGTSYRLGWNGSSGTYGAGAHNHTISTDGAHTHTVSIDSGGAHTHTVTITDPQHAHTASASNTGGGGAHNNMQPFILVHKIIKA